MSKSFLTPVGLFSAATDPNSASIGNIYFNTASNVMRLYFNSQWNSLHNVTASYGLEADHIDFSTNPSSAASVARLQWSPGEGTLSFGLGGGDVFLNIGQEEVAYCYNGTASTLTKGTVVYISGAQGQRPTIDKASASAEGESSKTLGVVAEDIASGSEGFVCTSGILRNVNTASFAEGSALWLSTTPGQMTTSKLYAPNHLVFIGYSIKQSANAGQIFVKIQNGLELYELHNVSASAPSNNDILVYNTSSSLWFNSSSANLTNLTVTNTINGRAASANVATHAGTASSIAGSLVTGYVASATVATHAGTASSIAGSLVSGYVASATVATTAGHSSTASSINASLLTGTTLPATIVNSSLTSVGTLSSLTTTGNIKSGLNSGGVALTINDGYGNANVTWNHLSGIPEQNGNAARIEVNTDATSGAYFSFELKSNVASGVAVSLTNVLDLYETYANFLVEVRTPSISASVISASALTVTNTISGRAASANVSTHAGTASSINSSLITGTTLPAAIVSSSLTGLGTLSTLNVSGNANIDSGTLYVDSSGFVGIGTTSHIGGKVNIINDVSGSVGFLLRGAVGQSVSAFRIQSSGGTNTVNINSETGGGYFEGNFGIGVLVPTTKLDVNGSALIRTNASVTGNLLVDTNTLFVDATNNEVGILTTSPASALHVAGGLLIDGNASFGGTITGTSTTQAVGNSSTSLATTEFVSRSVKYSADTSVNTSSVAGFFVFNVSGTASLGGVIMMPRGTAARVIVGQANTGINGVASAGFVRGYVENNAGTAVVLGGAVPFYYMAW